VVNSRDPAEPVCAPIHNRTPVVITPANFDAWLAAALGSEALLRPCPPDAMEAYPVSQAVGNVKNDGPELVEPSPVWLQPGLSGGLYAGFVPIPRPVID